MAWLQLTLSLPSQQAYIASEVLEELGAISVTMQDAAGEIKIETVWDQTPMWSKVGLSALFPQDTDVTSVQRQLMQRLELTEPFEYSANSVDDQDWATAWKTHYKPIHMGGRLWICPSWCEPPQPDAVNVTLDPGMAFGTGDHPTTALCLEALAEHDLRDKVILDFGCGSGILAIAALKLGAREAYAVDIDPQSLVVTRENAERNKVIDRMRIMLPDELPRDLRVDFLVANILARALQELAPTIIGYTRAGTRLALSGLLAEQGDDVRPYYAPPFTLGTRERSGWIALTGSRA